MDAYFNVFDIILNKYAPQAAKYMD